MLQELQQRSLPQVEFGGEEGLSVLREPLLDEDAGRFPDIMNPNIMELPRWMKTRCLLISIILCVALLVYGNPRLLVRGCPGKKVLPKISEARAIIPGIGKLTYLFYPVMEAWAYWNAEVFFKLFAPLRSSVLSLGLDKAPWIIGEFLHRFANMQEVPEVLPNWDNITLQDNMTILVRPVFWQAILSAKLFIMLGLISAWYALLVILPNHSERCRDAAKSFKEKLNPSVRKSIKRIVDRSAGLHIFWWYHASHHTFVYTLVDCAVAENLMSEESGIDWEIYAIWIDWLTLVFNIPAVCKYTWNIPTTDAQAGAEAEMNKLEWPVITVFTQVVPGIGSDMHLFKDWLMTGLCFQTAHSADTLMQSAWAYLAGSLSIVFAFLPIYPILKSPSALETFASTHWPISTAVRAPKKRYMSTYSEWLTHEALTQAAQQSTAAKQMVATWSEIPKGAIELAYGIAFGFKQFVVFAFFSSTAKVIGIPMLRRFTAKSIEATQAGTSLVAFARHHGFTQACEFKDRGCALHAAVRKRALVGTVDSLLQLLEPYPDVMVQVLNLTDDLGNVSLMYAIKMDGQLDPFRREDRVAPKLIAQMENLLSRIAECNMYRKANKDAETPLHAAVQTHAYLLDDVEFLASLIDNQADINAEDLKKKRPIHLAACCRAATKLLIEKQADVNIGDIDGNTPLHIAAEKSPTLARFIVEMGADCCIKNKRGQTPFHVVLQHIANDDQKLQEWRAVCTELCESKAAVNIVDTDGNTPPHIAAEKAPSVAQLIVENGADCCVANAKGETPLHLVLGAMCEPVEDQKIQERITVCRLLCQYNADIMNKDLKGTSPLSLLMKHKSEQKIRSIKELLDVFAVFKKQVEEQFTKALIELTDKQKSELEEAKEKHKVQLEDLKDQHGVNLWI